MFPQMFGKYVLERELASGGMAIVYLATLRGAGGFEKRLVVKQIRTELASDEAFVERFVAEAKTTVELSHPNIVPVYELGVEQGVYFIAMELAAGVTLPELLKAGGPLSPEEGAYLGVEICRALDYAHRKAGIVHRDVTPRNVLIDEEGAVRLIDFGIAAPAWAAGSARERVFGSPGHMPLEQLKGGRLTPATDVFAVAALLIEAWTGRPPFRRATKAESDAALDENPPRLSEAVPGLSPLDDLIGRALSRDAPLRPQTAEDLARPLREFLRSADLGDIARRLGGRVRTARQTASGDKEQGAWETPSTPARLTPVTPATRPLTESATETFATSTQAVEWKRLSSRPPPAAVALPEFRSRASEQVGRMRRPGRLLAGAGFAVAIAGGWFALRSRPEPDVRGPATAAVRTPPPVPTPGPTLPEGPSAEPAALSPPRPPSGPSPAESVERLGAATLTVTSDLPAKVAVDGALVGTTPQRVKKPPGRHAVTVTSVSLGERLATQVVLSQGATVGVHAEFTRPTPTLRVR